jgi:hypothetical protein
MLLAGLDRLGMGTVSSPADRWDCASFPFPLDGGSSHVVWFRVRSPLPFEGWQMLTKAVFQKHISHRLCSAFSCCQHSPTSSNRRCRLRRQVRAPTPTRSRRMRARFCHRRRSIIQEESCIHHAEPRKCSYAPRMRSPIHASRKWDEDESSTWIQLYHGARYRHITFNYDIHHFDASPLRRSW